MIHKEFKSHVLMWLLAFMPAAASAQYNNVPVTTDVVPNVPMDDVVPQVGVPLQTQPQQPQQVNRQYNQNPQNGYVQQPLPYTNAMYDGRDRNRVRNNYYENMRTKRRIERVDRGDLNATFIPKGLWMLGATVNYRSWENENQNLLVLKDLNMDGHTFSVSPAFGYFVKNNVAIGLRYNYSRNYFYLGNMDLNLGEDFNISLDDLYYLEHKHQGSFFVRTYMPIFGSKVMGFFSELRATYARTNGKNSTGRRDEDLGINTLDGTYENVNMVQLGFTPGLCCFVTDFAAVECSIGVLGIDYKWSKYKNLHPDMPEYEYGKSRSGGANFKFNMFSINIGMTFYL